MPAPHDSNGADYDTLLDLEAVATTLFGADFARWMLAKKEPLATLFRLADEGGVVLLPGKGFRHAAPFRPRLARQPERA